MQWYSLLKTQINIKKKKERIVFGGMLASTEVASKDDLGERHVECW